MPLLFCYIDEMRRRDGAECWSERKEGKFAALMTQMGVALGNSVAIVSQYWSNNSSSKGSIMLSLLFLGVFATGVTVGFYAAIIGPSSRGTQRCCGVGLSSTRD